MSRLSLWWRRAVCLVGIHFFVVDYGHYNGVEGWKLERIKCLWCGHRKEKK